MAAESENELPSEEELEEGDEEASEGDEEEGSSEEDEDESEDEEGSDDESEERPRRRPAKRQKAELPPPGRDMPQRSTRGKRMGALVKDAEEDEADEAFWNQEFFAEEAADQVYETESEPDDVADADFSESEGDEESGEEAEAEARAQERKKKALKPPGYKKPPLPPKPKPPGGAGGGEKAGAPRKRQPSVDPELLVFVERRAVRESTRQKVAEAEEERKMAEMLKPRRVVRQNRSVAPLTQAELLAEAAKTEIENTKSLQMLQLIEEQTKKRAEVKKAKYAGPMLRSLSRAVDGQERSTLEVRNMQTPPELLPQTAAPPPPKPLCAVTGQPAKYRDPRTGLPYASLEAYKLLQQRMYSGGRGPAAAALPAQHAQQAAAAAAYQQQQQQWAQMQQQAGAAGAYNPQAAAAAALVAQQQQQQQAQWGQLPAAYQRQPLGQPQMYAA